jgi:hypothetical protein
LARKIGVKEAIFLSAIIAQHLQQPEKWFDHFPQYIEEETALSVKDQNLCIDNLTKLRLISERMISGMRYLILQTKEINELIKKIYNEE